MKSIRSDARAAVSAARPHTQGSEGLGQKRLGDNARVVARADVFLCKPMRRNTMNLAIWLPAMFLLGLAAMGVCYLFLKACDKI